MPILYRPLHLSFIRGERKKKRERDREEGARKGDVPSLSGHRQRGIPLHTNKSTLGCTPTEGGGTGSVITKH